MELNRGSLCRVLASRCTELEAGQVGLKAQVDQLEEDMRLKPPQWREIHHEYDDDDGGSYRRHNEDDNSEYNGTGWAGPLPGNLKTPNESLFHALGHAVFVSHPQTARISFWNHTAEKLYGWKEYEVIGEHAWEILIEEDYVTLMNKIIKKSCYGQTWSGQFPFQKRSGDIFMALVTTSPMYKDGELVGIITVSSDATVFNSINSNQPKASRFDRRRIQCQSGPHIAVASSISELALRVLSRQLEDGIAKDVEESFLDRMANAKVEGNSCPKEESVLARPMKIAAKLFAKLQSMRTSSNVEVSEPRSPKGGKQATFGGSKIDVRRSPFEDAELEDRKEVFPAEYQVREISVPSLPDSRATSSVRGDNESNSRADSNILWEDLQLGVEIGQGSFAVVYHGFWNGSDIAVKVYFGKDYDAGTLLDYKKEIGIMRTLRHPNVLLFMGACYSLDRLAIVTEFLPRGSLFKILHKSSQQLDIKRRLRMALDVARGMNYLHRRNPPIIHRDLKSSNLLVDKNWNVKVGDFGLSKLKHATFLTAKSGGGTPQWMAPEVLRNERSNEKSDVFSFGVILWELVTVSIPWANLNPLQVVGVVGFMERRLDLPEALDHRLSSVISDCWQSKPELRPSFEDIIQRMTGLIQTTSAGAVPSTRRNVVYK